MEDLQFLTGPTIADFDGDGTADLFEASGGYYVHAFAGLGGGEPAGWPKFTGGWTTGAVSLGDIDGDGLLDVIAATREGRLYAWEGAGSTEASAGLADPVGDDFARRSPQRQRQLRRTGDDALRRLCGATARRRDERNGEVQT
jgi:hypothetical protein